ncbi:hypothetical protein [Roseinatronobacter sp.]|uniref:hypothetical protein n=1 Tax=Roseinatronobacter sp. TaxID=1945755 RepID=UPI003F71D0D8
MPDRITQMMFRGLVSQAGGVDAAAAVIEQAWGAASKGTVSKMCSGQAEITIAAIVALEEALGVYPVTLRLFERIGRDTASDGDLQALAARMAQDSGSAVSELVMSFSGASPDPERLTEDERARVNVQARKLRADCDAVIAATEAAPRFNSQPNVRGVS